MPDFADSLVARVRYKRNVLVVGPTGCLDYDTLVDIECSDELLNEIKKLQ
jgi:hypothetical protein